MIHTITYGDRHGYIRVLRFHDPARAYSALQLQCSRGELTQPELLWAMRQLAEVCRGIYAQESMAAATNSAGGRDPFTRPAAGATVKCANGTRPVAEHSGGLTQGSAGEGEHARTVRPSLSAASWAGASVGTESPAVEPAPGWITRLWRWWIGDNV